MARHCRLQDVDRHSRAGAFTQTHVEAQDWLFAKLRQQRRMRAFCTHVTRDHVVQCIIHLFAQSGGGCSCNKAIEDHRNAQHTCARHGTNHTGQLAPTKAPQRFQTFGCVVGGNALAHHTRFGRQTSLIHAGTASNPLFRLTSVERMGNRSRAGSVANAHFAYNQKVRIILHRIPASLKRRHNLGFAHRRALGEVRRGRLQIQRDYIEISPSRFA
mmetsp:Transcript_7699/g.13267  ORF Transcript_7699/g.13267 Transcript_7699/m.13267 type:complete len:215 (+) Transcript_7699:1069-1713(+)